MHKGILPACLPIGMVIFAFIIISCGKPTESVCDFSYDGKYFAFTQYITGEGGDADDKIAVFVEYDGELAEGFEGYRYFERKYIAVTGIVK